ncbi:MAG TPA: amino acid ABC transporter permease [bacterium]|nr:amino acid ABC transporter permease [bacterium]
MARTAWTWARQNLFNTWYNSILTLLALWVVYEVVTGLWMWGFWHAALYYRDAAGHIQFDRKACADSTGACWAFVASNWYLFLFGTYPYDERWRPMLAFGVVIVLGLVSLHPRVRATWWVRGLWLLVPLWVLLMVRGLGFLDMKLVDSSNWGGLMLSLILGTLGIVASFPIGILLALGRRSTKMPIIKSLCVVYIEIIRGVPLITVLFMSSVVLPLFLPEGFNLDKVLRAQVGIIFFSSAYLAEVVRGGLQAIPRGQEEAAHAVGLSYWQTMSFIVLPQALRIMIPALVSGAIALFKDTSLVSIIGLIDFLSIAGLATANPQWIGRNIEAYVFIAAVYWIFCFNMSRYSMRLEKRLKTGH